MTSIMSDMNEISRLADDILYHDDGEGPECPNCGSDNVMEDDGELYCASCGDFSVIYDEWDCIEDERMNEREI